MKVLQGALQSVNNGPGKVVNGGKDNPATVKVGNDSAVTLETVENPVPEPPHKQETVPYTGTGVLGSVNVGDTITYEISYKNYKSTIADVTIKDKLDAHVAFVTADNDGTCDNTVSGGTVTWVIKNVAAGKEGKVSLIVRVLSSAVVSKGGSGKVVNGGNTATVQVGNDQAYTLDTVENPVPEDGKVVIDKYDMSTKSSLAGATLQLLDKDGNLLQEWVSDGQSKTFEGLAKGAVYKIHESEVPKGYMAEPNGDVLFTISEDGTAMITGNSGEIRDGVVQVLNAPLGFLWGEVYPERYPDLVGSGDETEKETEKDKKKDTNETKSTGGSSGGGSTTSTVAGGGGSSVRTGDETPLLMWLYIAFGAMGAAALILLLRRRRRQM